MRVQGLAELNQSKVSCNGGLQITPKHQRLPRLNTKGCSGGVGLSPPDEDSTQYGISAEEASRPRL